jgi:hypothetical protein
LNFRAIQRSNSRGLMAISRQTCAEALSGRFKNQIPAHNGIMKQAGLPKQF